MNQQALPLTKNLVIPAKVRNPLAERHRVRRQPGYYAGQAVSHGTPTSQSVIVEMHGHYAELLDGKHYPTSALSLVANGEEWKPVEGFDGRYLISNHGTVVSTQYRRQARERVLKPNIRSDYYAVRLGAGAGVEDIGVNRLVANHFLSMPPATFTQVVPKDGNPHNLRWDNLAWAGTPEALDRDRPRPAPKGQTHYKSKLSDAQIAEVRHTYQVGGVTHKQLADKYGVSRESITALLNNRSRSTEPQKVTPRLSEAQVAEIRATYAKGDVSCERLGRRYGVSSATISRLTS